MISSRKFSVLVLGLLTLAFAAPTMAQDDLVDDKKHKEIKKKDGWDFLLTPSLSLSFADNRGVIGQPDGSTVVLGVIVAAGTDFRHQKHQWRNRLNITEAFSRTPVIDNFLKSTDIFKFETLYLYSFLDWLGPYARFSLNTAMLESFDSHGDPVTWAIARDGAVETRSGFNLRLTDGFTPATLRESAGLFATAYETKPLAVEIRMGFGGLHAIADGQLAIKDDEATAELEVIELSSFNQAGGEFAIAAFGSMYKKRIVYKAEVEFMMPFIHDELEPGDDRGLLELTNIEISASISFKLLDWMSLDYVLRAIRTPQLIDEFQLQNNLLLTMSYSFFKPEEKKK